MLFVEKLGEEYVDEVDFEFFVLDDIILDVIVVKLFYFIFEDVV